MHNLLREQAIQWLLLPTNKQTMLPFPKGIILEEGRIGAADEIEESDAFDEYVKRLSKLKYWAGNEALYALCALNRKKCFVYYDDRPMVEVNPDVGKGRKGEWNVFFKNKHYQALVKINK